MQITLIKKANQTVPFVYGGHAFSVTLRRYGDMLFASVTVDGENVIESRRVVPGDDLFGYAAFTERYGTLVMNSKYGDSVIDTDKYNSSVYLEYTAPVGE